MSEKYELITDSVGAKLCSSSQPSTIVPTANTSLTLRCGSYCAQASHCMFYQFKANHLQCELFDSFPNDLTEIDQCSAYAKPASPGYYTIRICSIK